MPPTEAAFLGCGGRACLVRRQVWFSTEPASTTTKHAGEVSGSQSPSARRMYLGPHLRWFTMCYCRSNVGLVGCHATRLLSLLGAFQDIVEVEQHQDEAPRARDC